MESLRGNTITLDKEPCWPPREPANSDQEYIKHVYCEGARFHVLSWSGTIDGAKVHCSEPKCIVNKDNRIVV